MPGYAMEELVAEIGAAFLCTDLDIRPETRDGHAAYIASYWPIGQNVLCVPEIRGAFTMTPLQFRTVISKVGLSQVQAAHVLGVTPRTARRWALGEVKVPPPAAKLLRLMQASKISTTQVKDTAS
jgi:Zincin-like metallopeptidase